MLQPNRTKFRKKQRQIKKTLGGIAGRGNQISFGDYGLVAVERKWITNRQIEAARIAMTRHIKRGGRVWIRVFPDIPYTSKPAETRMGKGKGNPEHWVAAVKPGKILFELSGVDPKLGESAMKLAASKLPIKCKFIMRNDLE